MGDSVRTNKRRIIVYALAIALAVTTVAYAVVQTTLNVSGTIIKKGAALDIYFANLKTPSFSGNGKSTSATLSSTNIEFTIELSEPLDSVTYYFDVVNSGTINAKLDSITYSGVTTASNKNIGTTFTYSDGTEIKEGDFLAAGVTRNLKLKIEYKDVNYIYSTDNKFTIKVTLVYMQYDGEIPTPGGDTSIIAECNHSCTGSGQTCTRNDIASSSGIRCKVKYSASLEPIDFYILGDDGTNLTMLSGRVLVTSRYGNNDYYPVWPNVALGTLGAMPTDNLPEFTYKFDDGKGFYEPQYPTSGNPMTAKIRLPRASDFANIGIRLTSSVGVQVPTWAAEASGSSYWLTTKYSHATTSSEEGNYYHVCVTGNKLSGSCGRFMDTNTERGVRGVIVIPRSNVKVNYELGS